MESALKSVRDTELEIIAETCFEKRTNISGEKNYKKYKVGFCDGFRAGFDMLSQHLIKDEDGKEKA